MIRPRFRPVVHLAMVAALFAHLAACQERITRSHYDRIENGMSMDEVEAILGEPTESNSVGVGGLSGTLALWKTGEGTTISIQFVNGRVVSKQFVQGSDEEASDGGIYPLRLARLFGSLLPSPRLRQGPAEARRAEADAPLALRSMPRGPTPAASSLRTRFRSRCAPAEGSARGGRPNRPRRAPSKK